MTEQIKAVHTSVLAIAPGQGWTQVGELGLAFALSALVGLEREWRQKSAGMRTHALVGGGAALFVLVSKHGFSDIVGANVSFDPSRVAAQIVTGIGFIGGGLIFVRGDIVRGLTTAAIVWFTAAIGMACGAGLWVLALAATAAHFVVVIGFARLSRALPHAGDTALRVLYEDGRGVLRRILAVCDQHGFAIAHFNTSQQDDTTVVLMLDLLGRAPLTDVVAAIHDLAGVLEVGTAGVDM
jgi:putative Mg2+ transporter-C (MgtC) family protein